MDYLSDFHTNYTKHVLETTDTKNVYYRIIRGFVFRLLDLDYGVWMKTSIIDNDMQSINNAIYQQCKVNLLPSSSGYDHCAYFMPVMEAIACGYYEAVEHCFPQKLSFPSNGTTMYVIASNLLMGIWYQDESVLKKIEPKTVKFLSGKGNQWEKSIVSFLYHLYLKDEVTASKDLADICRDFNKQGYSEDKKILCVIAHGLVSLATLKYPEMNIIFPTSNNFSTAYSHWRKENLHPELKLYMEYPQEMKGVSEVLTSDMIDVIIHQPYLENEFMSAVKRKQWVLNVEKMQEEFANQITKESD